MDMGVEGKGVDGNEQVTISFYADRAMKMRLKEMATLEERSVSNLLRRIVAAYVPLSMTDQAILSHLVKDLGFGSPPEQGLGSPQEAIEFLCQEWSRQLPVMGTVKAGPKAKEFMAAYEARE